MSKCTKRLWSLSKHKNSLFKMYFLWPHRVQNATQVSSETSLPRLVQSKPSTLIRREENKKRKTISKRKALVCPQKGIWALFWTFSFHFVSFIGVFSILKWKTLVLKTTTLWTRASHFVDGWYLLRYQIHQLLSHPLCVCPFDFCGGGGGWFSLGKLWS